MLVILAEEHSGVHRSPHFWFVLLLNLPWLALPAATIVRMARNHPFTELVTPPVRHLARRAPPARRATAAGPGPAGTADPAGA